MSGGEWLLTLYGVGVGAAVVIWFIWFVVNEVRDAYRQQKAEDARRGGPPVRPKRTYDAGSVGGTGIDGLV